MIADDLESRTTEASPSGPTATDASSPLASDEMLAQLRGKLTAKPRIDSRDPITIDMDTDPRSCRFRGRTRHGNRDFDVPYISQVTATLWMGGVDCGLELPDFIEHLVSLYQQEHYDSTDRLHSHLRVAMRDALTESLTQVDAIAGWINVSRAAGPTLVHCQAGLNRSAVVTARALMLGPEQMTARQAIDLLRTARSPAVLCNEAFEKWLLGHDAPAEIPTA